MKVVPLILSSLALASAVACSVKIPKNKTVVTTPATKAASPIGMPGETTQPSVEAAPAATPAAPSPSVVKEETVFRVPVGPALLISPGEGVGPVRFGAKLSTIQRLMEADCTELTEDKGIQWCRYQPHAVDFGLENDKLVTIHVHGSEREFTPGRGLGVDNSYGVFRGAFLNKAQLGMYPKFVDQGKPLRVQKVEPGRFPTVEKHYYENMVLEYDRLKNGNVVLGGVVLTKPTKPVKSTTAPQKPKTAKKRNPKPLH